MTTTSGNPPAYKCEGKNCSESGTHLVFAMDMRDPGNPEIHEKTGMHVACSKHATEYVGKRRAVESVASEEGIKSNTSTQAIPIPKSQDEFAEIPRSHRSHVMNALAQNLRLGNVTRGAKSLGEAPARQAISGPTKTPLQHFYEWQASTRRSVVTNKNTRERERKAGAEPRSSGRKLGDEEGYVTVAGSVVNDVLRVRTPGTDGLDVVNPSPPFIARAVAPKNRSSYVPEVPNRNPTRSSVRGSEAYPIDVRQHPHEPAGTPIALHEGRAVHVAQISAEATSSEGHEKYYYVPNVNKPALHPSGRELTAEEVKGAPAYSHLQEVNRRRTRVDKAELLNEALDRRQRG